jgi:hypothetical protein
MRSAILNLAFITGSACVVAAAFMVAVPLGLFALGCPLVAVSVHAQMKAAAK